MLKPRQETILKLIVDDYVRSAMPVGSGTIARHHDLEVSPATIRNEVAELEDAGYIARPYASAGSVPLDKAYRFYVESQVTVEAENIPAGVRSSVRRRFGEVRDADSWAEVAAAILARLVGNLAIVTFPRATESRVKHLELVPLEELVTMLILVFEHARLKRHIIRFDDPIEPRAHEELADRVKEQLIGLTLREIEAKRMPLSALEEEIVDAAIAVLREEEQALYRDHYVDGLRNLLNQPEFTGERQDAGLGGRLGRRKPGRGRAGRDARRQGCPCDNRAREPRRPVAAPERGGMPIRHTGRGGWRRGSRRAHEDGVHQDDSRGRLRLVGNERYGRDADGVASPRGRVRQPDHQSATLKIRPCSSFYPKS